MAEFVILPGGRAINLDQVAYIEPLSEGRVYVTFSATFSGSDPSALDMQLDKDDAVAFLAAVERATKTDAEPMWKAAGLMRPDTQAKAEQVIARLAAEKRRVGG